MKFQVREGFVCSVTRSVKVGDGKTEQQTTVFYPGNDVLFDAEQAAMHAHKLEPADAEASAWLENRALPVEPPATPFGLTADQLTVLTQQIAVQLAMQQAVPAGRAETLEAPAQRQLPTVAR